MGSNQKCSNPICKNTIRPKKKHAPKKLYCSPGCAGRVFDQSSETVVEEFV